MPTRRPSAAEGRAVLLAVCGMLIAVAVQFPIAQDWIPFHVAGGLATAGRWTDLYPPPNAASLLDAPPAYAAAVARDLEGAAAYRPDILTAFVSPPPAAYLLTPLRRFSWHTSMVIWRLALVLPLCAALLAFGEGAAARQPEARWRWSLICVVSVLLLSYTIAWGQPTAWLLAAVIASMLPAAAALDATGGVALALAVVTKATPVVAVAGLWIVGRKRLALVACAVSAAATVAAFPLAGIDAWTAFAGISGRLGRTVLTQWNNASLDALLLRTSLWRSDELLREPGVVMTTLAWLARFALLGAAIRSAFQQGANAPRRASAVWIAWLAATPLLWLHYLTVLLPLLGSTPIRRRDPALALAGLLSAPSIVHALGAPDVLTGNLAAIAWLASAGWLLLDRAWVEPVPRHA